MNTKEFLNRLKSFLWRLLGMSLAALLAFVSANIGLLELPPVVVAIIGLGVGELTKVLNRTFALEERVIGAFRKLAGK